MNRGTLVLFTVLARSDANAPALMERGKPLTFCVATKNLLNFLKKESPAFRAASQRNWKREHHSAKNFLEVLVGKMCILVHEREETRDLPEKAGKFLRFLLIFCLLCYIFVTVYMVK